MKLVISGAFGAVLGLGLLAPVSALADDAAPPALRGAENGDAQQGAQEAAQDPAQEVVDGAEAELLLAEARSAALEAAGEPGAVDDALIAHVARYALFQRDLEAINQRAIAEPSDLDAVMDTLAAYDARTLSDSWISYAAFVAAQQPGFAEQVLEIADYYGEAELVQGMVNEPEYVLSFPGARHAAAVALDIMRQDAAEIGKMSNRFVQESYDLQSRGWSNMIARDRPARLEQLRGDLRVAAPSQDLLAFVAYGAPTTSADAEETGHLRRAAFWSAIDYRAEPAFDAPRSAVNNGDAKAIGAVMTLAALRVLDVSPKRPDIVSHLLDLPSSKDCLDFALLHLRQCVAAAHFKYEDAFCIAEHQLGDVSECFTEAVEARGPRRAPALQQAGEETGPSVAEVAGETAQQ